jgi:p-hydroxybenzoate 3-monooxygenase
VSLLARGFEEYYLRGNASLLDRYAELSLARNWRVQKFAADLCTLFHTMPGASAMEARMQRTARQYLTTTENGQRWYAENFIGLPFA